jgi:hypothetical protein
MLAAIAAVAAAVLSVINVGLTARVSRRQDSTRWTRELLPDLVRELSQAYHEQYVALFNADWASLKGKAREERGMAEFRRVRELIQRLEVFAAPKTVRWAWQVTYELEGIRSYFLYHSQEGDDLKWSAYWDYAEANYQFLRAARREMSLKPPPIPPGLSARRAKMQDRRFPRLRRLRSRQPQSSASPR